MQSKTYITLTILHKLPYFVERYTKFETKVGYVFCHSLLHDDATQGEMLQTHKLDRFAL